MSALKELMEILRLDQTAEPGSVMFKHVDDLRVGHIDPVAVPPCGCNTYIAVNGQYFMMSEEKLVLFRDRLAEGVSATLRKLHPEPEPNGATCCLCDQPINETSPGIMLSTGAWMHDACAVGVTP